MREITLEELLEAGCHFGHQVTRQNPKAREFVFEARDNIHIIDLAKTKEGLEEAGSFIYNLAKNNGLLLIVGTKRQGASIINEEIERAKKETSADSQIFFVTHHWIGGLLTNFSEVSKNFKKLKDITELLQSEEGRAKYTKKELGLFSKEKQKLESLYGGVFQMTEMPKALFIVDTHLEDLAVREARAMRVTTVGIADTNSDPTLIDHPIPANDDAVGSIKLIVSYIIDAWIEGNKSSKLEVESLEVEESVKKTEEKAENPKETKEKVAKAPKKIKTSKTKKTQKEEVSV